MTSYRLELGSFFGLFDTESSWRLYGFDRREEGLDFGL